MSVNVVSTESGAVAEQVPYWAQDPKGTRYKIGEYILHEDGSYSKSGMSHAECKAKCEANQECVMIRVNTSNEQDCLMGSSVGKISSGNVDADVTSMRIISRTGKYVLKSSY